MNITPINQTSFYGRNVSLSQAREVCSMLQEKYPYKSLWKVGKIERPRAIEGIADAKQREHIFLSITKSMNELSDRLDDLRHYYAEFKKNPRKYYALMVQGIKKFQTLNCGEFSRLVYMTLRLNGVDDDKVNVMSLATNLYGRKTDLDHEITQVEGEKTIGIDALLGETDILENMSEVYTKKYAQALYINDTNDILYRKSPSPRLSDEDVAILKKRFPDLIIL